MVFSLACLPQVRVAVSRPSRPVTHCSHFPSEKRQHHLDHKYCLSHHPVLFRIFVETSPEPESILIFAARYGSLRDIVEDPLERAITTSTVSMDVGVPLSTWKSQILALQRAVELWDLVKKNDVAGLGRLIRWDHSTDGSIVYENYDIASPKKTVQETIVTVKKGERWVEKYGADRLRARRWST